MEKPKKKKSGILFYLIPVVLLTCMIIFGGLFLRDYNAYRTAEKEYEGLEQYITELRPGETAPAVPEEIVKDDAEQTPEKVPVWVPALEIDHEKLRSVNRDYACVVYVPALGIRYPVVHSHDNEDYLHHTFEGKYNYAGCIFLDCLSDGSFEEPNTFIFGHNMKNGSMFGLLKQFSTKPELCEADPYVYIYTADTVRKYRIFAFYVTKAKSEAFDDFIGERGYDAYVKGVLERSLYKEYDTDQIDFRQRPKLLTLSTCSGRNSGQRFLVHAAYIGESL